MNGTFRVKALSHTFGVWGTGLEYVQVDLEITSPGQHQGKRLVWRGPLGGKTSESDASNKERTIESLIVLGWTMNDWINLPGLGSVEGEAVVEDEVYNGKTFPRVKFINQIRPGLVQSMDSAKARDFAADMEARAKLIVRDKPNLAPAPSAAAPKPAEQAAKPFAPPADDNCDIPF